MLYRFFVEVTNITKGNSIWAHFTSTGCFPSQIHMSRPIQKEDVQIETFCCIFKRMRVNWSSVIVTGISGITITMPDIAHVSIFMDNDLTHITDNHFEIKLIARLLNQIYVIQPPMLPPRYDDAPPDEYEYSQPPTGMDGTRHQHLSSQNIYICFLPVHRYKVWLHKKNSLQRCFMMILV